MLAVPALDVSRVVEFINEFADHPRAVAGEQETAYPDPVDVLAWPDGAPVPALGELVAAANAAFRVFSAAQDGRAYEELNDLLRTARPVPLATGTGLCWEVDASGEVLPAALGTCLLTWLVGHEQARLGTCRAAKCVDVYADASPAGRRRFCSSTCLNRHKVAAYRRRSSRGRGADEPEAG